MKKFILVAALLVAGCAANSGVFSSGSSTFTVSRQAATGFSGSGNIKAEAMTEANDYCQSRNLQMEVVSVKEAQPPFILGNFPKAEVVFKCTK